MFRSIAKIVLLAALVIAGGVGVWQYGAHFSKDQQIRRLEQQKEDLERIVHRLQTEKRVAEVLVTDQKTIDGVLHTTLLFVEYAKDGGSLPPKQFTIEGRTAHVDAMVIKFEHDFVAENDPLRGHSIALFVRIYGDHQKPSEGFLIDEPGKIPAIYRGADPRVSQFEQNLWENFWQLAEDKAFRESKGVRVANGQGVWGPFEPDKLYTVSIESNGGLNIVSEPLRGIYREALKRPQRAPVGAPG